MVVDKSGSAVGVKRHDYLPFGEELYAGIGGRIPTQGYSQTDNVRQQFTGKERDASTGLDYFINRYYSSSQGRFTTADPAFITSQRLADPQMLNLYAYVRNNPLRYIDPDGMELYVLGPEAQTFVDDLERATGLQLHYDPTNGQVTVVGRVPRRMSRDAQRLYDLIKDKTNVVHMLTIRSAFPGSRPGRQLIALVGQQNGGGKNAQGQFVSYHIIDYDDVDKFNKPHGSQAPQIALHEVTEAYEAALLQITGRLTDAQFQQIHNAAIVYENASRARVPGLGQRGQEGPVLDAQGHPVVTSQGYNVGYTDYTSYRENITVDLNTLNVISVTVEKKQQTPPPRRQRR
jgi:RHS repeat-associated protein